MPVLSLVQKVFPPPRAMAFPLVVLPNDPALVKSIEELVEEHDIEKIVIGHSLGRSGDPNPVHSRVEELIQDLTLKLGLPIELEPEQYTTQEATRLQGKNEMTDAAAATIILNSFITRNT